MRGAMAALSYLIALVPALRTPSASFKTSLYTRARVERTSDRSHPEIVLNGIANANVVAVQIDNVCRAERELRGLHIEAI